MNAAIRDYARKLGLSDKALKELEREHRFHHGKDAEAQLTRYIAKLYRKCMDRPHIPARQQGIVHPPQYVADPAGALPDEPESPDPAWLSDRATEGWVNFSVVKGEELARKRERSLGQQVRQTVAEARKAGRDVSPHVERIEAELQRMKRAS